MPASGLRFSVVIPCRNAADTLGEQLTALAEQEYDGAWEVIVADNGSTDGSADLARTFADRLPGLRVVETAAPAGPGRARNAGAAVARGRDLLFCDADDRVGDGWLAALDAALDRHELVACRYETSRLNPPETRRPHPQEHGLNPYTHPPFLPHAGGGGLGIRRSLHEAVGGFDEDLPALEDTDYCWRVQLRGTPLVFAGDAVVHIRFRGGLGGNFRQLYRYGRYNVLIYTRYRAHGMPRLSPIPGLLRWAKLLLTSPLLLWADRRTAWISQLGWRLGRVDGCLRYRALAL
jgi:glycosyltransferase involved in cell wall biosynthesis